MALETFVNSEPFTFGVELEIQVVNKIGRAHV